MRIEISSLSQSPLTLMRRAGYAFQRNEGGEQSYVRVLGRNGFPRFHAYLKLSGERLLINVHLDQKKHTYGEETRHHGEYENEGALHEEGKRLLTLLGVDAKLIQ